MSLSKSQSNLQYTNPIRHTAYNYSHINQFPVHRPYMTHCLHLQPHTPISSTHPIRHTPYIYSHIHQFPVHRPYKTHCLHLQPHTPISSTQTLQGRLPTFTATYTNFRLFQSHLLLYIFPPFTDIIRTD